MNGADFCGVNKNKQKKVPIWKLCFVVSQEWGNLQQQQEGPSQQKEPTQEQTSKKV